MKDIMVKMIRKTALLKQFLKREVLFGDPFPGRRIIMLLAYTIIRIKITKSKKKKESLSLQYLSKI